jgi:two-component system, NarL family, nitrate/nitrite response regulator NarL
MRLENRTKRSKESLGVGILPPCLGFGLGSCDRDSGSFMINPTVQSIMIEGIARQIRILIVSRHAILCDGLKRLLDVEGDFNVVACTGVRNHAIDLVVELKPDILLYDVTGSDLPLADSDTQLLRQIARKKQDVRSILLTTSDDEAQIVSLLRLGVRGIVQKEAGQLLLAKCIRAVMMGGYWISRSATCELVKSLECLNAMLEQKSKLLECRLSGREMQVIGEVISGSSNKDIAKKLSISEQAVKYHLTKIYNKTGSSTRMKLARFAIRHQLVRET